jgi:hypothetical protein
VIFLQDYEENEEEAADDDDDFEGDEEDDDDDEEFEQRELLPHACAHAVPHSHISCPGCAMALLTSCF